MTARPEMHASTLKLRVVVPARNEQRRIGALLASVTQGLQFAAQQGARWRTELVVVLDRCTDDTRPIALRHGASVWACPAPGGKVEALRTGMTGSADVFVCLDADVVLGPRTLFDLVTQLTRDPRVLATCPPLCPEPPRGPWTPLKWALYRYNAARGFSSERLWLSGRCYAVPPIAFPSPAELHERAARHPDSHAEPGLAEPLQADDIWLSRALLARDPRAIEHVATDPVFYRAPSSLRGMSRTYRRLRRELQRIERLFPELPGPGRDRRVDEILSVSDALAFGLFQGALSLCRLHAELERRLSRRLARAIDPWPVVDESKT